MGNVLSDSERSVEMTHGKARYFEKGSGEPCILLHGVGYTGGGNSWYCNIDALASQFRVLAPDMLGWGTGDRVERHLAFPYLVEFVREFQDVLGLEKSHVVGHSLGGWVAQILAYESPERIDKLVLVASAGHDAEFISPAVTHFQVPTREQIGERLAAFEDLSAEDLEVLTEAEWQNINAPNSAACFSSMIDYMANLEERRRYITPRRWSRIVPETLVISGTRDAGYPPKVGKEMAGTMPHARQLVFEAGHFIPMEVPNQMNDAVIEFLAG